MRIIKLMNIICLALCLGACSPKHNDYSEFKTLDLGGWAYGDTLTYNVEHQDSIAEGDLLLAIRHTNNYLYQNLWLEVRFTDANRLHYTDTLNIILADVYGRWNGKGIGISFQKQVLLKRNLRHAKGSPVKVRHIMRTDTLREIELVGIDFVQKPK